MKSVVGVLVMLTVVAAVPQPLAPGVFSPLRIGTKVGVREQPGGFVFTVMPGVEVGHTVAEVGADYIAVDDPSGMTQTRIPVTAIRSVTLGKSPPR